MRPQNGSLIFSGKKTHSETISWKSSRILRVNPNFLSFLSFFIIFLNVFSFFFLSFFHFPFFFFFLSLVFSFHFFSSSSSFFSSRPSRHQNPQKTRPEVPVVKKRFSYVKIRFLGLGGQGGLGVAHLRVTSLSCFFLSFLFLGAENPFFCLNCFTSSYNISFQKITFLSHLGRYSLEAASLFLSLIFFFNFFLSLIFSFFHVDHFSSFFFSFSVSFLGCSTSDFFLPQLLQDFLYHFFYKTFF